MSTVSMLEQLQSVAVTALGADSMFNGGMSANGVPVPIIQEYKGDISTDIETALGKVGICAVVTTPLFEFINEQDHDLSGWALLNVAIGENVALNQGNGGTGIRAIALAQQTLALLHWYPTGLATGPAGRPAAFVGIKRPITLINEGPPLAYGVNFQTHVRIP